MRYVLASSFFFALLPQAFGQSIQPIKIQVNGVELYCIEKGQGETLILLHGGMGDYRSWNPQIQTFAPRLPRYLLRRRYHYPNQNPLNATNHSALVEAKDLAAFLKIKNQKGSSGRSVLRRIDGSGFCDKAPGDGSHPCLSSPFRNASAAGFHVLLIKS